MDNFIELLERRINGCDALGGMEREKAVYQSVLKEYKKQLVPNKLTESEKEITRRLLNIADNSDFFEERLPKGSTTLKSVWSKISNIRKKLNL